jgi:predicted benzoate:H+ symporter BenE
MKRTIAICLVILAAVVAMSLDVILATLSPTVLTICAVASAAFLVFVAAVALICSMHSSMISRLEEEEARRAAKPQ